MAIASDFAAANLIITQSYAALRAAVSTAAQGALDTIVSSPVPPERVSEFYEFGYAHRADLTPELREAVANVGHFAWINGFWGLGFDGRGSQMEMVLRGTALPDGIEEPAALARYAPASAAAPLPIRS